MAKKNLIIDTNVFLSDSECFEKFENNDLFVPIKVLEELDKHKTRQAVDRLVRIHIRLGLLARL